MKKVRFEITVEEKIAKKIKKYCIDKGITQGKWAEIAYSSLVGKTVDN